MEDGVIEKVDWVEIYNNSRFQSKNDTEHRTYGLFHEDFAMLFQSLDFENATSFSEQQVG